MGLFDSFSKKKSEDVTFEKTTKFGFLAIDEKRKLFRYSPLSPIFKFEDLVSFELIEDNQKVTEGGASLGRAMLGGAAVGTSGATAAGLSKIKKTDKDICTNLQILFTVKNNEKAVHTIPFLRKKVDKSKFSYHQAQVNAKATLEGFNHILGENAPVEDDAISNYDELKKLKELLDLEILTQEEFDQKKKELMGL